MAMLGFFTFGSVLAFLDLAAKNQIEAQDKDEFPKELKGTKGKIWLYKNHTPGLSFGVLKECPKAMELVPLCITSAFGGAWTYILGKRGCFFEKLAATLVMAGGVSNLYDRMRRGHVVDYLCLRWKALKKVVFNLGDLFILAGSVLLILVSVLRTLKEIKADIKGENRNEKV